MSGLRVSGNKIFNDAGQTVRLLGANYSMAEYNCRDSASTFWFPIDQAMVNTWKNWGFTAIRIPMNENCWLGTNSVVQSSTAYRSDIQAAVNLMTSNGLAVILDLHWNWPGTGYPQGEQTCAPDADHSPAFWTSVANTFKGNSSVVFDLFNEPCQGDWACWADGGNCGNDSWGTISYTAVGMNQLLAAVRATGATNIVMVGGRSYAHDMTGWLAHKPTDTLNPSQLVAAFHIYGDECGVGDTCLTPSGEFGDFGAIANSYPIIAGEFGGSYGGGTNANLGCDTSHPTAFMKWLNARGQHYTAWAWNGWPYSRGCSDGDFPLTLDGTNPNAFGTILQKGIAGTL